ncbi:MAG: ComF family protein [Alphaproteobacteria bacterium]|nr:ComF family protein [Alphaproteobacteria bacterium]
MSFLKNLLNILLPPRCLKCGKILSTRNGLCAECFNKIHFISAPMCHCCGRPFTNTDNLKFTAKQLCGECLKKKKFLFALQRSAFLYDDESKNLILDLKFRDKTSYAETLANFLYTAGADIWKQNPDIIIPVPIHRKRLLKRRYNQCALLANRLSEKIGIPVDYHSLIRTRNTVPQVELSGKARRTNLKHAFEAKFPQNIKDRKVVLIDDVSTTGSTLNECGKVLHKAGAAEIYALTLARTE